MQKLEDIQDIDDEIFNLFQEFVTLYPEISKCFPFPKALFVFMNFITTTSFIKGGICELSNNDNNYSIKILFRSLIEQYLKFQYIYMKLVEEKNDEIGSDYLSLYAYSEEIEYANAWKKTYEIINATPIKDPIDTIKELYPKFGNMTTTELKKKISQFNYRNVINYVYQKIGKSSKGPSHDFLLKIIPEYSELSSFVHGGPNSHTYMHNQNSEELRMQEAIRLTELAILITASVKLFVYLVLSKYDKRIEKFYSQTFELMKKLE